jgi:hypothetical protein
MYDLKAVVQVGTQGSLLNRSKRVPIGGSNNPRVHVAFPRFPQPAVRLAFQNVEQSGLKLDWDLPNHAASKEL